MFSGTVIMKFSEFDNNTASVEAVVRVSDDRCIEVRVVAFFFLKKNIRVDIFDIKKTSFLIIRKTFMCSFHENQSIKQKKSLNLNQI